MHLFIYYYSVQDVPKSSSIRPVILIEHRLVTDRQTDRQRGTACTAYTYRCIEPCTKQLLPEEEDGFRVPSPPRRPDVTLTFDL